MNCGAGRVTPTTDFRFRRQHGDGFGGGYSGGQGYQAGGYVSCAPFGVLRVTTKDISDLDITTARRPPLVATIKDTSAESGAIREDLHQRQGDIKVVTGLRRGSEDIINPALGANRPTKVVSRLPVVSAIINPGTVAISHRPTMEVGSVTTAQAEATNRMGTAGRRQVMAAAERRMGIPDRTTHMDMQVADTGRDSKHTLHLTLARPLIRRYAASKHHASLMDKIEGKIEMTVGEKMHNPAMGEHSVSGAVRRHSDPSSRLQSPKVKPSTRATASSRIAVR